MRELMSLLVVAAAMSLVLFVVSVVAPVLLVDSLVAPTVLEGCSVVDFVVSVVATELLGLVLDVVVSVGCVEVLDVLGVVVEGEELGLVEVEDVLGVLLANVELLELEDEEVALGDVVVCCVCVWSCVRLGSVVASEGDDVELVLVSAVVELGVVDVEVLELGLVLVAP